MRMSKAEAEAAVEDMTEMYRRGVEAGRAAVLQEQRDAGQMLIPIDLANHVLIGLAIAATAEGELAQDREAAKASFQELEGLVIAAQKEASRV